MRLRWLAPLAGALMVGCGYNTIQSMDERAAGAKQQIEVQLQRRSDLIGNLVNTVKRYAAHEEAVFTGVAEHALAGRGGAIVLPARWNGDHALRGRGA